MQSPMVQNATYIPDKSGYGEMEVLHSPAGYYIGTMWNERGPDGQVKWQEPGSRDSGYYATEEEAAAALKLIYALGDETAATVLRQHP